MTLKLLQDGVKFKCTGCGKCCTGAPGYVWVTQEEIEQLAVHLKMTIKDFSKQYVRRVGQKYSLVEKKNGDCVFLKEKKFCSVYSARPKQCRTYPFWPNVLRSKETWEAEKSVCEGIDHESADHYTKEQLEKLLEENYGEGDRH